MDAVIERLMKYKKDSEYICVVEGEGLKSPRWHLAPRGALFTKSGSFTKEFIEGPLVSKYLAINCTDSPIFNNKSSVTLVNGFIIDIDEVDVDIKNGPIDIAANVEAVFGRPTFKVSTSCSRGNTHLIYLFNSRETRVELCERISYTIAKWCGSDRSVYRVPKCATRYISSINEKTGDTCTLLEDNKVDNPLDFFLKRLKNIGVELVKNPAEDIAKLREKRRLGQRCVKGD